MQLSPSVDPVSAIPTRRWGITDVQRSAVDDVLSDAALKCGPRLAEPIRRVFRGGKRLRPAVTLAVADRGGAGAPNPAALAGAAAVELLHWATLVHDDVIDGAGSRHGQPSVNAVEGLGQAVVTGDLLLGAAFELGVEVGPQGVRLLAQTLTQLCIGQAREEAHRFDDTVSEHDVMAVISGKTGSLLASAARLGGLTSDLGADAVEALGRFGLAFGMSLQILDDILDLVSSVDRLGKPTLADFAQGTITLPAVAALRHHPELREFVRPDLSPLDHDRAVSLLRDPEPLSYATSRAVFYAEQAAQALSTVPDCDRSDALTGLAGWPRSYLDEQLDTKVEPSLLPLLAGGYSSIRQIA